MKMPETEMHLGGEDRIEEEREGGQAGEEWRENERGEEREEGQEGRENEEEGMDDDGEEGDEQERTKGKGGKEPLERENEAEKTGEEEAAFLEIGAKVRAKEGEGLNGKSTGGSKSKVKSGNASIIASASSSKGTYGTFGMRER